MRLHSAYSPERCREALQTALGRKARVVRGHMLGNLFRLSVLEKRSFGRRDGVSYTLYGRIREGGNGRAEVCCRRFLGFSDPLKLLAVYAAVLLILRVKLPGKPILLLAGVGLAACAATAAVGTLIMFARVGMREALRDKLDAFLWETLDVRE